MSHKAKKNVLFLMIGPPALMVPWLILLQFGTFRTGCTRLFDQLFGFNAVFWTFQVAAPWNWLVPERVEI
jgi:hypothetical protein